MLSSCNPYLHGTALTVATAEDVGSRLLAILMALYTLGQVARLAELRNPEKVTRQTELHRSPLRNHPLCSRTLSPWYRLFAALLEGAVSRTT